MWLRPGIASAIFCHPRPPFFVTASFRRVSSSDVHFIFLGLCGLSIVSVGCPLGRGWTCFEVMTIINLQKTIIFFSLVNSFLNKRAYKQTGAGGDNALSAEHVVEVWFGTFVASLFVFLHAACCGVVCVNDLAKMILSRDDFGNTGRNNS